VPALGLDFQRRLAADPGAVHAAILRVLESGGFKITASQLTRIEAKRGSRMLSGMMIPPKMLPVAAMFDVAAEPGGCRLDVHLVDAQINLAGRAWGLNQTYRDVLGSVAAEIDHALARLDPAAAAGFATPAFWSKGGDLGVLDSVTAKGVQATGAAFSKAGEVLEGGPRDTAPEAWDDIETVTIHGSAGWAVLTLQEVQAHLGIAAMVFADEASMPANLRRDVTALAARAEAVLTAAGMSTATIELAPAEEPVFGFLHQQAQIRASLPARTLHTCTTCRLEKITNEDFERLRERNERLRTIVGAAGATIGRGGVQPFILLGQLFRLKKLDPDYVCPKCQGMEADERLVTFCPTCGEMLRATVIQSCPKCKHDFRTALPAEQLWSLQAPVVPSLQAALPPPAQPLPPQAPAVPLPPVQPIPPPVQPVPPPVQPIPPPAQPVPPPVAPAPLVVPPVGWVPQPPPVQPAPPPLTPAPPVAAPCGNCGAALVPGGAFCFKCGTKVG
jgi:hypothetical protein